MSDNSKSVTIRLKDSHINEIEKIRTKQKNLYGMDVSMNQAIQIAISMAGNVLEETINADEAINERDK